MCKDEGCGYLLNKNFEKVWEGQSDLKIIENLLVSGNIKKTK